MFVVITNMIWSMNVLIKGNGTYMHHRDDTEGHSTHEIIIFHGFKIYRAVYIWNLFFFMFKIIFGSNMNGFLS